MHSPMIFLVTFMIIQMVSVSCYNILGIFPFPSRSHVVAFDALMQELAIRGHNLTVYTAFASDTKIPGLTQVDIGHCFQPPKVFYSVEQAAKVFAFQEVHLLLSKFSPKEEEILRCEPLLKLRNSSEPFDLLITETFHNDFFQLFGYILKIPVITFHSMVPFPWMSSQIGLPQNPSYIAHPFKGFSPTMNFIQKLENTLLYLESLLLYQIESVSVYDQVAAKYFDMPMPSINEVAANAALLFLNTHFSLSASRPLGPNVVEIGGLHIKPAKPIPKHLEEFVNGSSHGVVYFCMGSLIKGNSLSEKRRDAFLYAFSKIPQRVLWKWEGDELPGQSDNIMISKWMPQRDILAHPNVKLFISHGGLLGISEAVYENVPVLGIPIFGDQRINIKSLKTNGAGDMLEFNDISKELLLEKIQTLLNNESYAKNAQKLSKRYRDRPLSAMDTAVYWTEYVINHNGAPYLKSSAVNMSWFEYLLLDVAGFLIVSVVLVFMVIYWTIKSTINYCTTNIVTSRKQFRSARTRNKVKRS